MKNAIILASFCGTGKTYICGKTDIKSVEVEYYNYKITGKQNEYVDEIKKHIQSVDYIFISTDTEGLNLLHKEGFDITLVYPKNELREEYLNRYIERDNSTDFIGSYMKYWHTWINELKEIKYCQHIVLESGQYLFDVV